MSGRAARAVLAGCVAALVAGSLWHARAGYFHEDLSGHAVGSDDAYISFRYAQHLAAGQGLVFNAGERVEGYSNLLYVLLLAPAFPLLGAERVYGWSVAMNTSFAAAALLVLHRHLRERLTSARALVAAALFAACPTVWLWVASGLETPLVLLVQVAIWAVTVRAAEPGAKVDPLLLPVLAVVSVLCRADGFLAPAIAVAYLAARRAMGAAWRTAAALALSLGALVAWRLVYYGHPLPNTYYAKVSGPALERMGEALLQLRDLALQAGLLPYLLALLLPPLVALARRAPRGIAFESVFAAVWLLYWVWVGGDVFGERFLTVLVPLGAAVIAGLGRPSGLQAGLAGARTPAAVVLALTLAFQLWPLFGDRRFRYSAGKYDRWVELGRLLAAEAPRGRTLAVCAAGKIPFFSGLTSIDMLGLADAHIAHGPSARFRVGHSKYDADYVLSRRPHFIATWIDTDLNLRWDLPRARWEPAGYRLRYLAYTRRRPPGRPILDVSRLGDQRVSELVRSGYQYAVLERRDEG